MADLDNAYHHRKESLQQALEERRDISDIAELCYIDNSGMAPSLQPTALRLNRLLTARKTRNDLVLAGIIIINAQADKKQRTKKKKKSKKIKRTHGDNMSSTIYSLGDRVVLTKRRSGTITYIGKPHFAKDERIGIDLDNWSVNGHDGSVGKFRYFTTKYGHAIFVTQAAIIEKLKSFKSPIAKLNVGDYVEIKDNRKGVIRYIGPTGIVRGCLVGIELDEKSPAGHDGGFGLQKYFQCTQGYGIFVRLKGVVKILSPAKPIETKQSIPVDVEKSEQVILDLSDLAVGDYVELECGITGMIKFIGNTSFAKGELFGIEMETWASEGGDGVVNRKRYFSCRQGYGKWSRRSCIKRYLKPAHNKNNVERDVNGNKISIMDRFMETVEKENINENAPVNNNVEIEHSNNNIEMGKRVKLTRGRFGVIESIDEMEDGLLQYKINIDELIDTTLTTKVQIADKIKKQTDIDSAFALSETIELISGEIGTIRYIGAVHFAKGNWFGVELHDSFGVHDGSVQGLRYFTCPAKRGTFIQFEGIKGRKNDDPTGQHLTRQCPECWGEFIKKRNPRLAYKSVGIVCDGCSKHGDEFSCDDWYFQCGKCQQTDFCLQCMLKLPSVSAHSCQNIQATFKQIGGEWMFDDSDDSGDSDDGVNILQSNKEIESIEMLEKVRDIFEFFDADMDGRLSLNDIENIIALIDINWDDSKTKLLFDPPCEFVKFLSKIQTLTDCRDDILDKLLCFIDFQIGDVFKMFDMVNLDNWSRMDIYQQQNILYQTEQIIDTRLMNIFNYFDENDCGTLNQKQINKILKLIDINIDHSDNYTGTSFTNNPTTLSFDMFRTGINLLNKSITGDILPALENYIHQQKEKENIENTEERKKFVVRSKRRESCLIEKHLDNRPKISEVIAKNILFVTPEIDAEIAQSMKKLKRVRDMIILNRRLHLRPSIQTLYAKHIAPYGAFDRDGYDQGITSNSGQKHYRQASQKLMNLLPQRPSFSKVVQLGILMNGNQQFDDQICELLSVIDGDDNNNKAHKIINNLKEDYSSMMSQLNEKIFEYKEILNEFEDDVVCREQKLRRELENKQRILLHMDYFIKQQRNQYQIKINQIKNEYKYPKQEFAPQSSEQINKQYEERLNKQKQQITKFKQEKTEMVKIINNKMRDLKFTHQKELQKERQIANILYQNHKQQIDVLRERQQPQMIQMEQQMAKQMEELRKAYSQAMKENQSLKKSKNKLEKIVLSLSSDIVRTANKK